MKRKENRATPKEILVSPEDAHITANIIWTIEHHKKYNLKYAGAMIAGKRWRLHRYLMQAKPGQIVDHINGNGLDNRRENLRFVTNRENALNSKPRKGKSKFKGVYWDARRKTWYVQVRIGGKGKYIGTYPNELAAALAYNKAALEYYGEFARLNEC